MKLAAPRGLKYLTRKSRSPSKLAGYISCPICSYPSSSRITLREGRYHQVRRMMAAIGNGVPKSINRIQIGKVTLENLPVGHWRLLTPEELEEFRSRRQKNPTAQGNVDSQDRPQRQKRNEGAIDDEEDEEEEDDNEEEEPLWADDEDEEEPKVKSSKPRAKQMYKEGPVLRK